MTTPAKKSFDAESHLPAPNCVFLQRDHEEGYPCFTWCEDQIHDDDLEYLPRADVMKLVYVLDLIANGRKIDDDTWEVIDQEDMELFAREALAEFNAKHGE